VPFFSNSSKRRLHFGRPLGGIDFGLPDFDFYFDSDFGVWKHKSEKRALMSHLLFGLVLKVWRVAGELSCKQQLSAATSGESNKEFFSSKIRPDSVLLLLLLREGKKGNKYCSSERKTEGERRESFEWLFVRLGIVIVFVLQCGPLGVPLLFT